MNKKDFGALVRFLRKQKEKEAIGRSGYLEFKFLMPEENMRQLDKLFQVLLFLFFTILMGINP